MLWALGLQIGDCICFSVAVFFYILAKGLPVFYLGVLHLACSIFMDTPSVDCGESLRWRVCPALEFCTVGVELFALSFFVFCPCRDCRELVWTVALVGAQATLPFSRGA